MPLPIPIVTIVRNDVDISNNLRPFLVDVTVEENFDSDFTPSKLELRVSCNYPNNWNYKDKLEVYFKWLQLDGFVYSSNSFYIDYVEESKSRTQQYFNISAIEQDLNLSRVYNENSIVYNNNTITMALNNVATVKGLTLTTNATPNVYLGVCIDGGTTTCQKKYSTYFDVIKDICNTYGYIGKLNGKKLSVFKLSQPANTSNLKTLELARLINLYNKKQVSSISTSFRARFIDRAAGNVETILNLGNTTNVTSKINNVLTDGVYFNYESALERTTGLKNKEFYDSFSTRFTLVGQGDSVKAGDYFFVPSSYKISQVLYIALKVVHKVSVDSWTTEITGFPMYVLNSVDLNFKSENI